MSLPSSRNSDSVNMRICKYEKRPLEKHAPPPFPVKLGKQQNKQIFLFPVFAYWSWQVSDAVTCLLTLWYNAPWTSVFNYGVCLCLCWKKDYMQTSAGFVWQQQLWLWFQDAVPLAMCVREREKRKTHACDLPEEVWLDSECSLAVGTRTGMTECVCLPRQHHPSSSVCASVCTERGRYAIFMLPLLLPFHVLL